MTSIGGKPMSWIKDVKVELNKLDLSIKSLRKFGLSIGLISSLISLWFFYANIFDSAKIFLIVFGFFLFLSAIIYPSGLIKIYKIWMGFAFALGWFISRFLLTILFITVLTPISLLAKIFKKNFLNLSFNKNEKSYWIKRESNNINYKKMY